MTTSVTTPIFKVLLLGESGAGKSNLMLRFVKSEFHPQFLTTIGIDFDVCTIQLDGKPVKIQIWDTAGQERFRTITHSYFRGTHGVLVVYDVTSMQSFENIEHWMSQLRRDTEGVQVILVGNKADLESMRVVSPEMGNALAARLGVPFLETSAKLDLNVSEAFLQLTRAIHDSRELASAPASGRVTLEVPRKAQQSRFSTKCCK